MAIRFASGNKEAFNVIALNIPLHGNWSVTEAAVPKLPTPLVILELKRNSDGLSDQQIFDTAKRRLVNKTTPVRFTPGEGAAVSAAVNRTLSK